ncbi:gag-protease polyprotein [Cucumis melo var. makuwa]|uniref:Gag-protease polyprotein n=1 Tax=Cucumis melo var. makuwa TaxID=1194695 RepID=A0A5A7SYW3_CUCMM|nr:gag-protease polyprotein [Cucumis melo var. makuwa]
MRLKESLVVVREMLPRRRARRGGRGGRGRGAGCVQPEVQPVAQATDPAAPVTHADLATMEQRFRDLIMQMREQQQPAPLAPAPAPVYTKCLEDQKVQRTVFMLTDRGTAWWETIERMLGGDEFLNLEQGDRTVEQFDAEFDMLSRFAPEMIATEAARADKFVRGLRLDIKGLVEVQPHDRKGRLSSNLFQCHNGTSDQVVSFAASSRNLLSRAELLVSPSHLSLPSSAPGHGSTGLTFEFSGLAVGLFGGSFPFLGVDSIEGHNRVSGKGFPTTGPRVEAGNVVIHRGLHVSDYTG